MLVIIMVTLKVIVTGLFWEDKINFIQTIALLTALQIIKYLIYQYIIY